ncbi:MAG: hypothetical protein ACFFCH_06315 [Promethearchaeota archaeon]
MTTPDEKWPTASFEEKYQMMLDSMSKNQQKTIRTKRRPPLPLQQVSNQHQHWGNQQSLLYLQ